MATNPEINIDAPVHDIGRYHVKSDKLLDKIDMSDQMKSIQLLWFAHGYSQQATSSIYQQQSNTERAWSRRETQKTRDTHDNSKSGTGAHVVQVLGGFIQLGLSAHGLGMLGTLAPNMNSEAGKQLLSYLGQGTGQAFQALGAYLQGQNEGWRTASQGESGILQHSRQHTSQSATKGFDSVGQSIQQAGQAHQGDHQAFAEFSR